MTDIEREEPIERAGDDAGGRREPPPDRDDDESDDAIDDGVPRDSPAAGVLNPDLVDPPEPSEPG